MGAVRIAILVAAAAAAIALALVVRGMMAQPEAPQIAAAPAPAPEKPMAQVLVAKRDLPIGARLTAADIGWQAWPIEALNANFITDGAAPAPQPEGAEKLAKQATRAANDLLAGAGPIQALTGALVKEPIMAGEPITSRKLVRGGESGYMAVVLQPGMRAVSIPVTSETGAGGFILPGDRVDVMQSRPVEGARGYSTEILMQNVRVLAIDQTTEPTPESKTIVGAVATLEIPAADVEVLARGRAQGEMMLALRSYADIGAPVGRGVGMDHSVRVVRAGDTTEVAVR